MIELKSRSEVEKMRRAAGVVSSILSELERMVEPGVTTKYLDREAEKLIKKHGAKPAFKNYQVGPNVFPAVLCVSVNEEIVHGIPGPRELREGDIISLDFGVEQHGWHGDSAVTIAVGEITPEATKLVETTLDSLLKGIEKMVPGNRLSDIGHAIQCRAEIEGYGVVRQFVGHGIGRQMHEPPQVPNYGRPGRGPRLREGMVLAIEPMVNLGTDKVRVLKDEWTAVTADGRLSAHFEHTVLITGNGPEVLTRIEGSY